MIRPGQRGSNPNKSVPHKFRPNRLVRYEEQDSGIAREKVNADRIVAERFDASKYIEKFPHGYDPFAGDETALKKKVLFRPNKYQIDAIINKKKHGFVNMESGVNGQGKVMHEKKFLPKNATYVSMTTDPIAEAAVIHEIPELEKHGGPKAEYSQPAVDYIEEPDMDNFKYNVPKRFTQNVEDEYTNPYPQSEYTNVRFEGDSYVDEQRKQTINQPEIVTKIDLDNMHDPQQPLDVSGWKKKYQPEAIFENSRIVEYDPKDEGNYVVRNSRKNQNQSNVVPAGENFDYDEDPEFFIERNQRRHHAGRNNPAHAPEQFEYPAENFKYTESNRKKQQNQYEENVNDDVDFEPRAEVEYEQNSRRKQVSFSDNQTYPEFEAEGLRNNDGQDNNGRSANSSKRTQKSTPVMAEQNVDYYEVEEPKDYQRTLKSEKAKARGDNPIQTNQYNDLNPVNGQFSREKPKISKSQEKRMNREENPMQKTQYDDVGSVNGQFSREKPKSSHSREKRLARENNPVQKIQYDDVESVNGQFSREKSKMSKAQEKRLAREDNPMQTNQYNDLNPVDGQFSREKPKISRIQEKRSAREDNPTQTNQYNDLDPVNGQFSREKSKMSRVQEKRRAREDNPVQYRTTNTDVDSRAINFKNIDSKNRESKSEGFSKQKKMNTTTRNIESATSDIFEQEMDNRDYSRLAKPKLVKSGKTDNLVMIAVRNPTTTAEERVKLALEKSKKAVKGNANKEVSESTAVNVNVDDNDYDQESLKQHRTYSAQGQEKTDATFDVEPDSAVSLKSLAEKQGNQSSVDPSDYNSMAPTIAQEHAIGPDPEIMKIAETKKHVAREKTITTEPLIDIRNADEDFGGLKSPTRSRHIIIKSEISAKPTKQVMYRRKVKK